MSPQNEKILIPPGKIGQRIGELGDAITRDYAGQSIICVGILRGAFVFLADLVRHIDLPMEIEFIRCSSYGNSTISSGKVEIEFAQFPADFRGKNVLIIDDILDAGFTLSRVVDSFENRRAGSVKTCVLLDKPSRRTVPFSPDYTGFAIDNHFVIGYGMDFDEKFRNLPYIGALDEDEQLS